MVIFGVILAGGQARRMGGQDKAFLPLAGRPLLSHVLARLAPQVDRVLISANGDPARFATFGCEVIPDARPQGPLAGVLAALIRARELGAAHVVSVPVDTPRLPADLVRRLREAAPDGRLVTAATPDRSHPATALWPVAVAPALAAYLEAGEAKVAGFTKAHGAAEAVFPDPGAFLNLNTPEDLARAEDLLRGAA